jgi:hypothetical protein
MNNGTTGLLQKSMQIKLIYLLLLRLNKGSASFFDFLILNFKLKQVSVVEQITTISSSVAEL